MIFGGRHFVSRISDKYSRIAIWLLSVINYLFFIAETTFAFEIWAATILFQDGDTVPLSKRTKYRFFQIGFSSFRRDKHTDIRILIRL